jgi:hypothetical protein
MADPPLFVLGTLPNIDPIRPCLAPLPSTAIILLIRRAS